MARVWLSLAHMGGAERDFVKEAFDTNWVVPLGPNVNGFENDLEQWLNQKSDHENHVVALSAGTAAIHLGLVMLGVGKGDEVICQSFTFAASANPITYQGATPVFVDSETDTWNMDPGLLEEAIHDRINKTGKKPKAIIPVYLYGNPAKIGQIMAVASKYDIPVLEDSAEAMGSTYDGFHCGTFGRFGVMSFNGNKMITTSGGGALICRSKEDADRVKFYATQARENFPYYQHERIGYNYRLSNVSAGIGRGQMQVVDQHLARRIEIHHMYASMLSGVEGISVMEPKADRPIGSNYWLSCICVDAERLGGKDYRTLANLLASHDIESRPLWKPMHLQPVFSQAPAYINGVSERMFNCGLCLPSGPMVSNDDVERIVDIIKGFVIER
ncbi:MAG: aminotransferase class I/II-fold pyridoxal phosphate-dependent enzyme [Bacteroidaceae bacterium]|nr:aminotransferase class I/II-fold pyridoxal phosphate-dependent enzyme [Bacteroidaceae bacterium]